MGRSLNSCFKIMSCAGDSAKRDDILPAAESKTSPGKHRWSFQKRATSSNNVITESIAISNNKQNQTAAVDTVNSEKASVSLKTIVAEQTTEASTLPLTVVPSNVSVQVTDNSTAKVDYSIHEDVVVAFQASIRGYLAKRELEKIKNVVKLQACIRRYLVRRQAVGTLRCLLAIVKFQQIRRARRAIQSTEFAAKEKLDEEMKAVKMKSLEMKSKETPSMLRNLASNAFTSQLLKSTLTIKPIHISCDPLRPDSGWIWLERWMSLTSTDQQKIILKQDDLREDTNTPLDAYVVSNNFPAAHENISSDSKLILHDSAVPAEIEMDSISNSFEKIEIDAPSFMQKQFSTSPIQNEQLDSHIEEKLSIQKDEYTTGAKESSDSVHSQIFLTEVEVSEFELNVDSNKPNYSEDTNTNSAKKDLHEIIPEMEIGQVTVESRKSRNPVFAAVQAKFEELSVASSSNRSINHASKDSNSDPKSVQSQLGSNLEQINDRKSVNFQVGTKFKAVNEVATLERSDEISGTFSPERSETGLSGTVPEIRTSKGVESSMSFSNGDITAETDDLSCDSNVVRSQIMAKSSENIAKPAQVKQQSGESNSTALNSWATGSAKGPQVDRSSQEGSPISHITVPEPHETPSSQISTDTKATKSESISVRKKRSRLLVNSSPTNSKNDSGAQTSGEQLKKDMKTAKRRNSFSVAKSDLVDQEHQTSSNNLPSYMQPTESARAKINISISQKSSPDIHDKDNHIKKRHSLPNEDGKQSSSPRMQRSTSQVQQNHNFAEKRWLR